MVGPLQHSGKRINIVLLLGLVSLCLSLGGCGIPNNDYDSVTYRCGVSRPDDHLAVKILSSTAANLSRDSIEIRMITQGSARVLPASDQGCIFLAVTAMKDSQTRVAIRHIDRQSAVLLTPKDLPKTYNEVSLQNQPSHFLAGSPKVDCLATHRQDTKSTFGLKVEANDELNLYQVEARIKKLHSNRPERVLVKNAADFGVTPLPTFETDQNGNYEIDVKLSDAFNPATAPTDTCSLRVDTLTPIVAVQETAPDSLLEAIDNSSSYQPGMPIDFQIWDNSAVMIHYCLMEGHSDDAQCNSKFNLAESSINAPKSGKWTLLYYGKDAAGWQTELRTYKFIVVHRDLLQTISNRTAAIESSLQEHRLNYAYSQIFQSLLGFFHLPSLEERAAVKASLHQNVNQINQRYPEIFHTADKTKSYLWVRFAPNGHLLALRDLDQTLEIFDRRFNLVHSLSSVAYVSYMTNEYIIARQLDKNVSSIFTYKGEFIGELSVSSSAWELVLGPALNFINTILHEQSETDTYGFADFDRYGDQVDNAAIIPRENETLNVLHVSASRNLTLFSRINTETESEQIEVYQTAPLRKIATHELADHCRLKIGAVSNDKRHVVMALVSSVQSDGEENFAPSNLVPSNSLMSQPIQGSCGLIVWNIQDNTYRSDTITPRNYTSIPVGSEDTQSVAMQPTKDIFTWISNHSNAIASYQTPHTFNEQTLYAKNQDRTLFVSKEDYKVKGVVFKLGTFEEEVQTLCKNTQSTWTRGQVDWAVAATKVCGRFTYSSNE